MANDANISAQMEARVVAFRPRVGSKPTGADSIIGTVQKSPPVPSDLAKFERSLERDDYWHRMTVNAAGLAFTAVLIVTGIWIAQSMAAMRKNQDCVLMGRKNCTPVEFLIDRR